MGLGPCSGFTYELQGLLLRCSMGARLLCRRCLRRADAAAQHKEYMRFFGPYCAAEVDMEEFEAHLLAQNMEEVDDQRALWANQQASSQRLTPARLQPPKPPSRSHPLTSMQMCTYATFQPLYLRSHGVFPLQYVHLLDRLWIILPVPQPPAACEAAESDAFPSSLRQNSW